MIGLMTPQGFVDLMGTMWPELIDAMPFGIGRMVMPKVMGNLMPHVIGDVLPLVTDPMIPYLQGKQEKRAVEKGARKNLIV